MTKKILVLGGYGRIGRRLLQRLRDEPGLECTLGGRDAVRGAHVAAELGVDFAQVDVTRAASVKVALDGTFSVIHAAGPFQWRDYGVASACIRHGVHYLDVADVRSFVVGITSLDERARGSGACVVSGAGIAPALSAALVQELSSAFDHIDRIDVSVCGNGVGGPASVLALFAEGGRPVRRLESGRWRSVRSGTSAAEVRFSAPLGRRRLYCRDAPDLELFPQRFGAATVHYQAAYARRLMRAVQVTGWLRSHSLLAEPERLAPLALRMSGASAEPSMGLRVGVSGSRREVTCRREIEMVARGDDTLLSCAPVLALLQRWQRGEVEPGARPCVGTPAFADIKSVLAGSGVLLSIT